MGCVVFTGSYSDKVLDRLKMQLKEVGISVKYIQTSKKFWNENENKSVFSITTLVMPEVDPLIEFTILRSLSPFAPFVPPKDKHFEKLFVYASKAESFDVRVASVKDLSAFILDHSWVVPLAEHRASYWYRADRFKDLGAQDRRLTFIFDRIRLKP